MEKDPIERQIEKNNKKIKKLEGLKEKLQGLWHDKTIGNLNLFKMGVSMFAALIAAMFVKSITFIPILFFLTIGTSNFIRALLTVYDKYNHKVAEKFYDHFVKKCEDKILVLYCENDVLKGILNEKSNKVINNIDKEIKLAKEELKKLSSQPIVDKSEVKDEMNLVKKLYTIKKFYAKNQIKNKNYANMQQHKLDKLDLRYSKVEWNEEIKEEQKDL